MSKVIDAYPREGIMFRTKPVFQYDYGQIIKIHLNSLPATYKVEFSNSTRADAVPTVQTTDEATIPAQFLDGGSTVYAWIVVVDENSRTTEYALMIPVTARSKPTDTEPTPEEQSEIDQAIAALNGAVDAAETAIAHYPKVQDGFWYVWDVTNDEWVNTGVLAQGPQGEPGAKGANGTTFTPFVSSDGVISWTNNGGEQNPQSVNIKGPRGETGSRGEAGSRGEDGYSPTASVSKSGGTVTISITDKNGTTTAQVTDGADGQDGVPGQDGVSPAVTISSITGGHRVTVTDAEHTTGQYFDVMDGADGQSGQSGQDGSDGSDGTTFTPAVSSAGLLSWSNDGGKQNPSSVDIVAAVLAALPTWTGGSY